MSAKASSEIYLVRHGETEWNSQGRFHGRLDSALTMKGREQALQLGRRLARVLAPRGQVEMHVSPLGRARQTAEILRQHVDYSSPVFDARLHDAIWHLHGGEVRALAGLSAPLIPLERQWWNALAARGQHGGAADRETCMQLAARTTVGILLAFGSVSTANAQTAPPPSPVAGQPAPPAAPPAAPIVAPPANAWPAADTLRLAEPMSRRLILNRGPAGGGGYLLERGGLTLLDSRYATGLDLAVAGSDRAVNLALEAHSNLVTGAAFSWTGIGLQLASVVTLIALEGVYVAQYSGESPPNGLSVAVDASIGAVLVGVVLELIGAPYSTAGSKKECDAVNAYNSDLVDGLLKAR